MANAPLSAWPPATRRLTIGAIVVDLRYRLVVHAGTEQELTQRCFDLLLLFLAEPGALHTRDEIFRRIWPGLIVEDANLTTTMWMLRKALGPEAKSWIRTVAKQGYVFDPPHSVQPVILSADPEPGIDAPLSAAGTVSLRAAAEPPARPDGRRRRHVAVAVAMAAALLILVASVLRWQAHASPHPRVVLVVSAAAAQAADERWPAELLQSWLDWKLRSVGTLNVDRDTNETGSGDDLLVLLGAEQSAEPAGEWRVSARFHGPRAIPDIVATGSLERLPAVLDAVSRQVYTVVSGPASVQDWPPLDLSPEAAVAFVAGLSAGQQHRWSDAVRDYRLAVERSPAFGYARLLLAESLVELGQQGAAEAEAASAAGWVRQLPATAAEPVAARLQAVNQRYGDAAAAFAALVDRRGADPVYQLAQARSLRRAGRSAEALALLQTDVPPSPAHAIPWFIERAMTELASGSPTRALSAAEKAEVLARRLGWAHERARALMVIADAQDWLGHSDSAATALAGAAEDFLRAGDRLGTLCARLSSGMLRGSSAFPTDSLDELLAEARAAGNLAVEVEALRRSAFFHYRRGDTAAYRERMSQAAAVAESGGDRLTVQHLTLDLLHQDLLRGDYAAADRRIVQLRGEPSQGVAAYWLGLFEAGLAWRRGDNDRALAIVNDTERMLRGKALDNLPSLAAGLGCLRGEIALAQGRPGAARVAFASCRATDHEHHQLMAALGEAALAVHGGDVNEARRRLAEIERSIDTRPSTPDRWILSLEFAPLLARTGRTAQARQRLETLLPAVEQSGYSQLEADTRITLAEIALAEGNWPDAEQQSSRAAALTASDDWVAQRRLRTINALLDQRNGEADAASRKLAALDADAQGRNDVLAELLAHSVMQAAGPVPPCSEARHQHLLARSGLRGASDMWMTPAYPGNAATQRALSLNFP